MNTEINNKAANPVLIFWIVMGLAGFFILPWYGVEDFFLFEWLTEGYPFDTDYAPAGFLLLQKEKIWLSPLIFPLFAPLLVLKNLKTDPLYGKVLILAGAIGNVLDSLYYGVIFSDSLGRVAEFMPESGGYAPVLQGKVVDMFYFPLYSCLLYTSDAADE